jgi:hypothetical protein
MQSPYRPTNFAARVIAWTLSALLLLAGLVFTASLLVAALVFTFFAVVAALLTGRMPNLRATWQGRRMAWPPRAARRPGAQATHASQARQADDPQGIVDVETREVAPTAQTIDLTKQR